MSRRTAIEALALVAIVFGLMLGVRAFAVTPYRIPSGSMEPTLDIGRRILVNRFAYSFGDPKIGDVIVFHPPSGADRRLPDQCGVLVEDEFPAAAGSPCPQGTPGQAPETYVKRIVAGPGDTVSVEDGHPVVDGVEKTDEPYTKPCGEVFACTLPKAITVPDDEYFVMGDNRGDSDDSRFWGPVPRSAIIGKVFASYWPPGRAGGV